MEEGIDISEVRKDHLHASREYQVGGTSIQVGAREILPLKERDNQQEALVLFLGWGANEKASSYNELSHSLADSFGRRVLLVNTRPASLVEDSLYHEAEATHQFLEEMDITDAILAGYSQGGAKAVNLAAISQKNSTIKPEALVLLAPIGLDAQTSGNLVTTFALDTVVQTIPRIATEKVVPKSKGERTRIGKVGQSLTAAVDIVGGAVSEAVQSKKEYPDRLAHEIKEMVQKNPRLKELEIPVILIQGKYDKPAGPKGDLTKEQMAQTDVVQDEKGNLKYEKVNLDDKDKVASTLKEIFPNSQKVVRVLAKRSGNHAFVLLRSPQIARVVSYLTKRQSRSENKE